MTDWKKLKKFKKVANFKSLNLAAKTLNISQSTISRDIIKIEKSLNIQLFERLVTGVQLTNTGKELLKIINEFDSNLNDFQLKFNKDYKKQFLNEVKKKAG